MNDMSTKKLDLFDFALYVWQNKFKVISCVCVCLAICGAYLKFTSKTEYKTELKLRLPQYLEMKDYQTALEVANGEINKEVSEELSIGKNDISINPEWIKDTSVIRIIFKGSSAENVKRYGDLYQTKIVSSLSKVINEKLIRDWQLNNSRGGGQLMNYDDAIKYVQLRQVHVIKKVDFPEKGVTQTGKLKKLFLSAVLGFGIGISYVFLKFITKEIA